MKPIVMSIIVASVLIGGAFLFTGERDGNDDATRINNVSIVDDKQIIKITAKGGYLPRKTIAKSGVPTVLRFDTKGTFDCSSSVRIPSFGISKMLPQTGETDVDLGLPQTGKLQGMCGMGMYPFEIDFQN